MIRCWGLGVRAVRQKSIAMDAGEALLAPGAMSALLAELARAPDLDPTPLVDFAAGKSVGRFEILREIGRGGFGVVYEARDTVLGRPVALKLMDVRGGARAASPRALDEAEAAARLQHPNVVAIHDVGSLDGHPFAVMELLRGESLSQRLARGPLELGDTLRVAVEIAKALAHAHAAGVVHRDLKPGNVFLCDDGAVKLLDFGLAHVRRASRRARGGTPGYMAPEQERDGPEDERVDVFAFGMVLASMLLGEIATRRAEAARSGLRAAAAPRSLKALIARCLAADPALRPRDGVQLTEALHGIELGMARRRRVRAALVTAPVVVGLAAAGLIWRGTPVSVGARPQLCVTDATNSTGDPELDGVSALLAAALEASGEVRVASRTRMADELRLAGRGDVAHIDEAIGREAAAAIAAGAVVVPSVHRFDDTYVVEVGVLEPRGGDRMFSAKGQRRGKSAVPGLVDELAREVLRRLGAAVAPPASGGVPLTASIEASHHYLAGRRLADQHRADEAIDAFRRAVRADPGLALAQYEIAALGAHAGVPLEERSAALREAVIHLDRLPGRHRELVLALDAALNGRDQEAIGRYRRLADAFPDDKEPPYLLADLLFHAGDARGEAPPPDALDGFERALALDPAWPPALTHAIQLLGRAGRHEEAIARARRAVQLSPGAGTHVALAVALSSAGDREGALAAFRRAVELSGRTALMRAYQLPFLIFAERLDEAEAEARAIAGAAPVVEWTPVQAAALLAYQGRRDEGRRVIFSARAAEVFASELGDATGSGIAARRAVWAAGDGDRARVVAEARRFLDAGGARLAEVAQIALALAEVGAADDVRRFVAKFEKLGGGRLRLAPAVLAWRSGDRDSALRLLREIDQGAPDARSFAERGQALYYRGTLCSELGLDAEAVEVLRKFERVNLVGVVQHSWALPRSLYARAASHLRLGERDEALATVDRLLAMWSRADPGAPLLQRARALRAEASRAVGAAPTAPR